MVAIATVGGGQMNGGGVAAMNGGGKANGGLVTKSEEAHLTGDARRAEIKAKYGYDIPAEDRVADFGVDQKDKGTPDEWIPRHPELVRLTGRHPFNCEAPLSRLRDHGFITPVSLHYVRNHGYVPRGVVEEEWTVEVKGLVNNPRVLTMADIKAMPSRTLPVTLVCAGNRRKEENMVKQTIGFNWGAAGVSTTVWRGVRLCDVLKHCGIKSPEEGALHVLFEGAETLPGGGGNVYGTSIKYEVAMDPACDVLLAYEQNGDPLRPDHGFPIRTVIPGYIGGRTIKWLQNIEVASKESQNYYHFHDNRVLPVQVDAERANKEGWWYKPDFIINELNVQSAIWQPAHDEVLPISSTNKPYTVAGYAYGGGGRKIIRVEVTLDGGDSWELCDLEHPERPTEYGKYWCWCFWKLNVDVVKLFTAKEIAVRAWDSSMNTQPDKITWNVMGMMNNCWFRVKVHPCKTASGGVGLRFEHPTRPGNEKGGWMVKEKEEEVTAVKPAAAAVAAPAKSDSKFFTMEEVAKHDSEKDAWIVYHGGVYDCTRFLEDHPGGAESILINAGSDCTEEFDAIHSAKAKGMLAEYLIGEVATAEVAAAAKQEVQVATAAAAPPAVKIALNPKERIPFKLAEVTKLSHDVRRFRFALQSPEHVLGLPIGKHMFLSANVDGKFVMRAYTPTSSDDDVGYFDLVVKVYFRNVHPRFPDGGVMSQHLETLKVGDTIDVKGPVGHIVYSGRGQFAMNGKPRPLCRRISMLAGGTGITPMYQVIKAILKDPEDKTEVRLLYANQTEGDILLREELEEFQARSEGRFQVWYTVDRAPERKEWKYSTGFISEEMVRAQLFSGEGEDSIALMCGPPPMIKFACIPNLEKVGFTSDRYFSF